MFNGTEKSWQFGVPASATASIANPEVVNINGVQANQVQVDLMRPVQFLSTNNGRTKVQLKLFGSLPIRTFNVEVLPELNVIPGGQSIGVKLNSAGMLVVGHHRVTRGDGAESPGQRADIRVSDRILEMNGETIEKPEQVSDIVQRAGREEKPIHILLARGNKEINVSVKPDFDKKSQTYQLGLYIRNSTSGVGTLTFYDPQSRLYGALGHVISDMDTGQPIAVGKGKIVQSNVTAVEKGLTGKPGEKRAIFFKENNVLGNIEKNSRFGIFGKMTNLPEDHYTNEQMPVALTEEVKEGPAHIYTVVEGQRVEKYDIEIVNVIEQQYAATKGMIIRVTDERLLEKTGGIVQGMSGSPIIQNGKLVGAVTHVFVNDPTSGYGTFVEWMLREAGIKLNSSSEKSGLNSPVFLSKFNGLY